MGLAETAQLLLKLTVEDGGTAAKAKLSIGDLGKTALAVGGAAGFAALTKGALDAESAQGKFMAATGKSREEAKKFVTDMDGLAGTAGAVGHSFEEIASTGQMVEQQFGTTGQKTQDLTGDILKFSKIAGVDATGAAGDLEDTLSAMGLSADDAKGFMDELVASNQKFGTDIGGSLGILKDMTPALHAMGLELDDGVGLLNAFETAGIDAGTAAGAMDKAVKNLKPGQDLDDLIAQIGSIEDPLLRAQTATEIFGKAAGPGMALLIKPGMTSLKDFKVDAKEAGGAVDDAADNLLTFGDRMRGFVDKTMAGAREIGQEFGPAITGLASISSLATPLLSKLAPVIDKVAGPLMDKAKDIGSHVLADLFGVGSRVATDQIVAAGDQIGEALGEAINSSAGDAVAQGAEGTIIGNLSADALKKGASNAGSKIGLSTAEGVAAGLGGSAATAAATAGGLGLATTIGVGLAAGIALTPVGPLLLEKLTGNDPQTRIYNGGRQLADQFMAGASDEAKDQFAAKFFTTVNTELENRSIWDKIWNNGLPAALEAGKQAAETYAQSVGERLPDDTREAMGQANLETVFANDQALAAAGIGGTKVGTTVGTAIATATSDAAIDSTDFTSWGRIAMREAVKVTSAAGAEAGDAMADATAAGLAKGLREDQGGMKAAWKDFVHPGEDFMSATAEIAWIKGKLTSKKLTDGLKSEDPLRRQWAEQEKASLDAELSKLQGLLHQDGKEGAQGLGDGLDAGSPAAVAAAAALARRVNNAMEALQTRYKINVTTGNFGGEHDWSGGGRASGGPVAGNRIYEVTEGGDPEMLRIGSRNFLLMGQNSGQVEPMRGPGGYRGTAGWSGGQMPNVVVNVLITARDIDNAQSHRNVIQGVSGGFK